MGKHDWASKVGGIGNAGKKKKRTRTDYSIFSQEDRSLKESQIQALGEELIKSFSYVRLIRYPDSLMRVAKQGGANLSQVSGFPDFGLYHLEKLVFRGIEAKVVDRLGKPITGQDGILEASQVRWWKHWGFKPHLTFGFDMLKEALLKFEASPEPNEKMNHKAWIRNEWWDEEKHSILHPKTSWSTSIPLRGK